MRNMFRRTGPPVTGPLRTAPPNAKAWDKSLKSFARDLEAMKKLVASPKTDLFAQIPHGTGQTILREALLVADHNAYHLGQVLTVRRLLGQLEIGFFAPARGA